MPINCKGILLILGCGIVLKKNIDMYITYPNQNGVECSYEMGTKNKYDKHAQELNMHCTEITYPDFPMIGNKNV